MKYVALLSGGKDSCHNLSHCHANAHELVAAATLSPDHDEHEIDSYLYQTVGQDAIHLVARALHIPLYRRVIQGHALEQGAEYGSRRAGGAGVIGDETEDLYALLEEVKAHHPDVQGVSVGAILSNYQRVRVEHVCLRLSLTPLSYLWQRDQAELLSEMIATGMDCVLIKVAGIGLTVKHLGKSLHEMHRILLHLNNLYGSHVCGEGGEYETLTLNSPLFRHRIVLHETEVVMHTKCDIAPVAYLRIKRASLQPNESSSTDNHKMMEVPPLLEMNFGELKDAVENSVLEGHEINPFGRSPYELPSSTPHFTSDQPLICTMGPWLAVGNIHQASSVHSEIPLDQQVRHCFLHLQGILESRDLHLQDVSNITLFLSSLAPEVFAAGNNAYAEFFGVSPPSRACVGADLPRGVSAVLECIAHKEISDTRKRKALHVQGVSYWAPANIGPYSQAVTVEPYVFVSGQIGLLPPSMTLPSPSSLALETALLFQHTDRVVRAANYAGGHILLSIYWLVDSGDYTHVRRACEYLNEEMPTLFLVVASLPRGARVEKQVLVHTGQFTVPDEQDEYMSTQSSCTPQYLSGDIHIDQTSVFASTQIRSKSSEKITQTTALSMINWQVSRFDTQAVSPCAVICIRGHPSLQNVLELRNSPTLSALWQTALSARLFHRLDADFFTDWSWLSHMLFEERTMPAVTSIACRFIWSRKSDEQWDWAVAFVGV